MPDDQVSDLEAERRRLATEIAQLTTAAQATELDKSGRPGPTSEAYQAQQRLTKLNDDYRQLLIAMKPAASTMAGGDLKEIPDGSGNWYRIGPDNTAVPVAGIPTGTAKPQTIDQITVPANGRIYTVDPNDPAGNFVARTPTTADEQDKANKVAQRTQNLQLNGHYATDEEILDFNTKLQKAGIDKVAAAEVQRVSEANQNRLDAAEKRAAALQPGTIAQQGATLLQTGATTGQIGANTAQIQQNIDIAKAKLGPDLAQAGATLAGTQASTAGTQASTARTNQQIVQGNAPTVQTPPTGMSQWTRDPNTGALTQGPINPEWQAKTQADIAARVGQIQSLANAKKAEVMGKVNGTTYTADQALSDFNSWYDQNVQPQIGSLQAAQQAAQIEQQKAVMAMRGTAMTQSLGAGDQAQRAYDAYVKTNAGPNYENVMSQITSGKPASQIDMHGVSTFEGPNVLDYVQQGTQNALKYIDPTMAQAAGAPPPNLQGIDIASAIGRDKYMPSWLSGGAPPPPPGGAAPAPPAPPPPAPLLPAGVAGTAADPRFAGMYGPPPYTYGG